MRFLRSIDKIISTRHQLLNILIIKQLYYENETIFSQPIKNFMTRTYAQEPIYYSCTATTWAASLLSIDKVYLIHRPTNVCVKTPSYFR